MHHILAAARPNPATGISGKLSPLTTFLHTVPTILAYAVALGLFLLLAKSEKLGGLSFRHVVIGLVFGLIGAVMIPGSWLTSLSTLATPGHRITADVIFAGIVIVEIIMIIRDRRKGGIIE